MKWHQIFTECKETDQDFIFTWRRYMLISLRICLRDGSGVVEIKTIFWWNSYRIHRALLRVISFMVVFEGIGLCLPLLMIALMNSCRESFLYWIMLPETCYSVFGKILTIDWTCAVSQAGHQFNSYEISPRIKLWRSEHKPLNFIELVIFKIIAFKIM